MLCRLVGSPDTLCKLLFYGSCLAAADLFRIDSLNGICQEERWKPLVGKTSVDSLGVFLL